jgi:hypothetical protein
VEAARVSSFRGEEPPEAPFHGSLGCMHALTHGNWYGAAPLPPTGRAAAAAAPRNRSRLEAVSFRNGPCGCRPSRRYRQRRVSRRAPPGSSRGPSSTRLMMLTSIRTIRTWDRPPPRTISSSITTFNHMLLLLPPTVAKSTHLQNGAMVSVEGSRRHHHRAACLRRTVMMGPREFGGLRPCSTMGPGIR